MADATAVVSVTNTATLIVAADVAPARRRSLLVYNNGTATVYLGTTNGVTTGTGFPVAAGASLSLDKPPAGPPFTPSAPSGDWYAIAAAGSHDVRVLTEG